MSAYSVYQTSPVTQQAVVSVNAGYDRFFCNYRKNDKDTNKHPQYISTDDHNYTIQQREIVFRLNPRFDNVINRPRQAGVNDIALKVFSSLNNVPNPAVLSLMVPARGKAVSQNAYLRSMFSFVGVAQTVSMYENKNSKDNLAVQVSGSCSIHNTGPKPITAGMKVCWDLPPNEPLAAGTKRKIVMPQGVPMDKHLFSTVPLDEILADGSGSRLYDFANYIMNAHDFMGAAPATEEAKMLAMLYNGLRAQNPNPAAVEEFIRTITTMYEEHCRSRVIGVALSSAGPGEQFDICLGTSH